MLIATTPINLLKQLSETRRFYGRLGEEDRSDAAYERAKLIWNILIYKTLASITVCI